MPQGSDPNDALISECGAMNLFFVFSKQQQPSRSSCGTSSSNGSNKQQLEVVTPPLDGTLLPGITRDSILQLLRQ